MSIYIPDIGMVVRMSADGLGDRAQSQVKSYQRLKKKKKKKKNDTWCLLA